LLLQWTILGEIGLDAGHEMESEIWRTVIDQDSFLFNSVMAGHEIENEVGLPFLHIPASLSIS